MLLSALSINALRNLKDLGKKGAMNSVGRPQYQHALCPSGILGVVVLPEDHLVLNISMLGELTINHCTVLNAGQMVGRILVL